MTPKQEKVLLSKLLSPVHISYISKEILKTDLEQAKEQIQTYINQGVIEEYEKDFFVIKKEKNEN